MQAAKSDGIAADLPVQGAEAHQVNRGFKDRHPIQSRVTGQPEGHTLVASGDVPLKAGAIQVISAALIGKSGRPAADSANENAVVMLCVLIQQTSLDKVPDPLGSNPSLAQVGEHPALILTGRGELKRAFLSWVHLLRHLFRRVPGPALIGQQVLHRLREALVLEPLEKGNGVPADSLRVAEPGAAVLDVETVYLLGGMVAADPLDLVSQGGQQIRQVRFLGDGDLRTRNAMSCVCLQKSSPLFHKTQNSPAGHPIVLGYPAGLFPSFILLFCGVALHGPHAGRRGFQGFLLGQGVLLGVPGLTGGGRGICFEVPFCFVQSRLDQAEDEFLLGEFLSGAARLPLQVGFDTLEKFL